MSLVHDLGMGKWQKEMIYRQGWCGLQWMFYAFVTDSQRRQQTYIYPASFCDQGVRQLLITPRQEERKARRILSIRLGLALKELNESRVWLEVLVKYGSLTEEEFQRVYRECDELCRILAASRRTAQNNARGYSKAEA